MSTEYSGVDLDGSEVGARTLLFRQQTVTTITSVSWWIGAVLLAPIFFQVSGGLPSLSPQHVRAAEEVGLNLPLSVCTLPLITAIAALYNLRHQFELVLNDIFVFGYFALMTFSFAIGLQVDQSDLPSRLGVYAQTAFPLGAYILCRLQATGSRSVHQYIEVIGSFGLPIAVIRTLAGMVWILCACLGLYLLQTAIDGGSSYRHSMISDHIGPFYNFRMARIYPIVLAAAVAFPAAGSVSPDRTSMGRLGCLILSLVIIACIAMIHCRTALLMSMVAMVVVYFYDSNLGTTIRKHLLMNILLITCAGSAVAGLVLIFDVETKSLERLLETVSVLEGGDSLSEGDENRFERMSRGISVAFKTPLGGLFQTEDRNGYKRVVNSESGFLDAGVRAGPLAILVIILILYLAIIRGFVFMRHARTAGGRTFGLGITACGIAFAFGNIWVNISTEPYSSVFFWYTIAALSSLSVKSGKASMRLI